MLLADAGPEREVLRRITQSLLEAIRQPVPLGGGVQVQVGASIGLALYPQDGSSKEELVRLADAAMYEAKRRGKNTFCFAQELGPHSGA